MKRVLILRGISGSGKSTFAQQLVSEGYHIISRDQRRLELLGNVEDYFQKGMDPFLEEHITKLEERDIVAHLNKGHKLIIDNTHIKRVYVQALVNIFWELGVDPDEVEMIEFDVPYATARERCNKRDKKPISDEVLRRQYDGFYNDRFSLMDFRLDEEAGYHGWIPKTISRKGKILDGWYEPRIWYTPFFDTKKYVPDTSLPKAVIVDIDGTSAHRSIQNGHMRSYYSYKEVGTDEPDKFLKVVLHGLMSMNVEPVFLSGRKNYDVEDGESINVYEDTKAWIEKKLGILNPTLYMRDFKKDVDENGKDLKDDIVKHRILHEEVAPNWCIIGAFDDRARVCAVWEDVGIKCLNCSSINEIGRF